MNRDKGHYLSDPRRCGEQGYTLLELMVVIALFSLMLTLGAPHIVAQFHERELDHAASQFIYFAQFARQQALYGSHDTLLKPRITIQGESDWQSGWQIEYANAKGSEVGSVAIVAQYPLPGHILIDSKGFVDPHSGHRQIRFNPAGAAKSERGGFVANRLVLTHAKNNALQRHVILAASGRWRICNPNSLTKPKGLGC